MILHQITRGNWGQEPRSLPHTHTIAAGLSALTFVVCGLPGGKACLPPPQAGRDTKGGLYSEPSKCKVTVFPLWTNTLPGSRHLRHLWWGGDQGVSLRAQTGLSCCPLSNGPHWVPESQPDPLSPQPSPLAQSRKLFKILRLRLPGSSLFLPNLLMRTQTYALTQGFIFLKLKKPNSGKSKPYLKLGSLGLGIHHFQHLKLKSLNFSK